MNLFGNCTCPTCALDTRFLLETRQNDGFYLLGDEMTGEGVNEEIKGMIECDYCQTPFMLYAVLIEGVFSAFLHEAAYRSYQNGDVVVPKASKKAGLEKERQQELTQFHENFATPFEQQPFEIGTILPVEKHAWTVQQVYKKEGVETDITKRLLTPTLDEYWYAVQNEQGEKKWCIVTDTRYERLFETKVAEKATFATELKRVTELDEWYEFEKEEEQDGEDKEERNAILTIEAPFLKENEKKFDVSDTLFQTTQLFEQNLTNNLTIKAYQYLAGVRFFLVNKEGELELDLFGENAESLLDMVQEQLSISAEEY